VTQPDGLGWDDAAPLALDLRDDSPLALDDLHDELSDVPEICKDRRRYGYHCFE
jgi:hypothetical protein